MSARQVAAPPTVSGATPEGDPLDHVAQPSRLKSCLATWRAAGASGSLLADLVLGVRWRWAGRPPPRLRQPNPHLDWEQEQAVDSELARLLSLGAVREVHALPHCCLPVFVVKKSSGKFRLVHDLRLVNQFLDVPKFRLEGLPLVRQLAQDGDLSCTVDLSDAYLHFPVHRRFQRFLGFAWGGRFFVWSALPFGLALSPRVFVKALRPVLARLRSQELRVVSFFDDFLLLAQPEVAAQHRQCLLSTLREFGLKVNLSKVTQLESSTKFLGVLVDTSASPLFRPAGETRKNLRSLAQSVAKSAVVSARRLAALLGLANFLVQSVPRAALFCRRLQHVLALRRSWSDLLSLGPAEREDLRELVKLVRNPVPRRLRPPPPGLRVETDASRWGWGATLSDDGPPALGAWSREQAVVSSNRRELAAVQQAVDAFADRLLCSEVAVVTDNSVTASYLSKLGGRVPELHEQARALLTSLWRRGLSLEASFRPGSQNAVADFLSRPDPYGLCVSPSLFQNEAAFLGPQAVDAFSTPSNAVLPRFWSRVLLPGAAAADALQQPWTGLDLWLFPPFPLLPRVLDKLSREPPRRASLLVPWWPAQSWTFSVTQWASEVRVLTPLEHPVQRDPVQPAPRGFSNTWTWLLCRRW